MPFWLKRRSRFEELDASEAVEKVLQRMQNDRTEARFQVLAAEADLRRLEEGEAHAPAGSDWVRQTEAHRRQVSDLREDLGRLEMKVAEAEAYAGSLAARASSARARLSLNELLDDLKTGDAVEVFDQLRSTVEQLEGEADGMKEVRDLLDGNHA